MLELQNLKKRFGKTVALADLSLHVRPGELVGFVGSNGAGKTTAMRIALGVLAADEGQVLWNGHPAHLDDRRHFGYMPEERGLYPKMKLERQLVYFARAHGLSRNDARRSAGEWIERLELTERRDQEIQKLSLGNQQRAQLAVALVHNPTVLVLDEPFSGLDPIAVDIMSQVLRQRADDGACVIFSSHQLDLVERLCDRIVIIKNGRPIVTGSVQGLREGAPIRYLIDAPAAEDNWYNSVEGAAEVARDGSRWTIGLRSEEDDQSLLRAATATGIVHEFRPLRPSLTDLFRHFVHDVPGPDNAAAQHETHAGESR